ncbi:IS701 family transposase [Polyangium mundeleinium]|uniref:IS701 family transposase n=1 Tax=Polyangium mundeleinium TaxID=2995306 RepID=A0ABT5F972_9BACT|nr:IS701 family transposase [Polyangium mundeleinium]MDC0749666.1 IS701 family transposase [Polyangium mundeleinium]
MAKNLAQRLPLRWFARVTAVKPTFESDELPEEHWEREFEHWFAPFLHEFGYPSQQKWGPVYLRGLLGPGDRKSIEPMAARVCPGETQQLHPFISTSRWDTAGHERVLLEKAGALVGGKNAHLIIDDTAIPKKGTHSVGVAHQYCGQLGKNANCQALVSITLARDEVPVPVALRLYLPKEWARDPERRRRAKVPEDVVFRTKWQIALAEIERIMRSGIEFGDVLADAGYGACAAFRRGLSELKLKWAVGVNPNQLVYPKSVRVAAPERTRPGGRPPKRGKVSAAPRKAQEVFSTRAKNGFKEVQWRDGTKGPLSASFAAIRVRVADGPKVIGHNRGPGEEAWLVCEKRANGVRKYYLSNYPPDTELGTLASVIKARWACEQAHQQMKEELGLDHVECRSWHALHHHALLTMMAFAFLQHLRNAEKKAWAQRPTA